MGIERKFLSMRDRRGMSLVSVLVAAGMMGGLAMFLANMAKTAARDPEKSGDGGGADRTPSQNSLNFL